MDPLTNPTTQSNWVIPGSVAIGAYPDPSTSVPQQLVADGFNVFVSLQTEPELKKFPPYHHILPVDTLWLQLPISDRGTTTDDRLLSFIKLLRYLLAQGKKIYIHCNTGHGRCGTLACVLLSQIEGLNYTSAIAKANVQHRTRALEPDIRIPECTGQRQQVQRLCLGL